MFALVFHGPGRIAWEEVPDPQLTQASDALVQIETTTICGTDLHILKGDVPAVQPGRVLGHEGVGVVTAVGEDVRDIAIGDVLFPPGIINKIGGTQHSVVCR